MGGGNFLLFRHPLHLQGLSPRGRGKPSLPFLAVIAIRSIPAWAGETPSAPTAAGGPAVYPRVGGGNGGPQRPVAHRHGLSPRGRGKPDQSPGLGDGNGSIPAWAGETRSRWTRILTPRVYPRVGGGNGFIALMLRLHPGLSPRGRGKLAGAALARPEQRSIPAWAGETSSP